MGWSPHIFVTPSHDRDSLCTLLFSHSQAPRPATASGGKFTGKYFSVSCSVSQRWAGVAQSPEFCTCGRTHRVWKKRRTELSYTSEGSASEQLRPARAGRRRHTPPDGASSFMSGDVFSK